ncbi:MAG: nitroreductase family protein [Patescibacteria group bacterium]|jgi:hypothetical protein
MISREVIEKILAKAVYAPSGDNSQPWHFSVSNDDLFVYNYPEKDLPFYNYKQCGSHVAHGALLENICIIASENGYECQIKLFPKGSHNELIAIVTFVTNPGVNADVFAKYVDKRVTNRLPYRNESIPPETKDRILSANSELGIEVKFIDDEKKIKKISLASVTNEMTVLTTKVIHSFFFKHIIWSEEDEKQKKSGLYVKTLEMPKPQEIAFRIASFWPIMKIINKLGITKKIAEDNAKLFQASPSFVAFLSERDTPEDFIALGRSLQRVWLACTAEGVSAHPITGVLFLYQRVKGQATEEISVSQQQMIKDSYQDICFQCDAGKKNTLFILRVGKASPPSATSSRLAPSVSYESAI